MKSESYLILLMTLITYLVRVIPLTLFRKPIKNVFIRSFLYYVPYVALAVMIFPSMILSTPNPISGLLAFAISILLAARHQSLLTVASVACIMVFVVEFFL